MTLHNCKKTNEHYNKVGLTGIFVVSKRVCVSALKKMLFREKNTGMCHFHAFTLFYLVLSSFVDEKGKENRSQKVH